MRTYIFIFLLVITSQVKAQDYFAIITKNDNTTINYPPTVKMILTDEAGNQQEIKKNDAIDVTGNYTLTVNVPWSDEPEILESNGGRLEIFVLPTNIRNKKSYTAVESKEYKTLNNHDKPQIQRKELFKSEKIPGNYNLLLVFDNGVTFRWFDGEARAWKDGEEVEVANKYLIETDDGLLKVSFNPKDGETWWTWEL